MPSILEPENLDLVALRLTEATMAQRATCLQLIQYFDTIKGFWQACVEMVTPTFADIRDAMPNKGGGRLWATGSCEQTIDNGIRDPKGHLTDSFIDWFERHCDFDSETETRQFLLSHLRPAEYADLDAIPPTSNAGKAKRRSPRQLQTKFALSVIKNLKPSNSATSTEIYPDFARKGIELADKEPWPQDLYAEIEPGTGVLVVNYTSTGTANRLSKKISAKRFAELLALSRKQPNLS